MLKIWDGTNWSVLEHVKYWTGSAWDVNNKSKTWSATNEWLPRRTTNSDISIIVKWNIAGRTPPATPDPTFPVPNIMGLTQAAANTAIQEHFNIGEITYITTTDNSKDGTVASQTPQPLLQYVENSFINYTVYEYVTPTATVPSLNGLLKSQAESAITSLGLVVGAQDTIETYDTTLIGRVVANVQYPTAGTVVDVGTVVTFDYYVQKPFATMPQLVGQDEFSVYSLLSAVNLDPGTRTTIETFNEALEGKVESQQYNAGQQLQAGTTVNYRVYIPNANTTVPSIIGKTPAQASDLLNANELYLGTETTVETTNASLEGTIASQQYGAGTSRPVDTTVNYVLYIPNTTTSVPNIVNQTVSAATSLLAAAELYLGYQITEVETSNTALHNKIQSQTPAAGTIQPVNSSVNYNLYVPLKTATVPSIVGLTTSTAASTLAASGFVLGYQTSTTNTNNQAQVGQIASQSPAAGTTQILGSNINYVSYVLNPYTTVPNLVGQTVANANTLLTNAGLNIGSVTETPTSNAGLVGTVASQGTSSGTSVLRGSSINYVRYRAYITNTVTQTKTGTAYIWSPNWQSTYYGSGSRRTIDTHNLYFGRFSTTSTTGDQVSLIKVNDASLNSACNAISGNRPFTVTNVQFNFQVQSGVGNSSKPVYFGYAPITSTGTPGSITYGDVYKNQQYAGNLNNGQSYSINLNSSLRGMCFTTPTYALAINASSNAASHYGALVASSVYFAISIQWTETTTTQS